MTGATSPLPLIIGGGSTGYGGLGGGDSGLLYFHYLSYIFYTTLISALYSVLILPGLLKRIQYG